AALCGLGVLAAYFPAQWAARLAAPDSLPAEANISGTIWNGQVSGLAPAGPIDFHIMPKNLFGEKPLLSLESHAAGFSASIDARANSILKANVSGRIDTFSHMNKLLAGLNGGFDLRINGLEIDGDKCVIDTGQVSTDVLTQNIRVWSWSGPALAGPVSCDGNQIVLNLAGDDGKTSVNAIMRIGLDGLYTSHVTVQSRDNNLGLFLPLYGFEKTANGYSLKEMGKWR
ncbi:MAG: type II secretion system protein N, partial [Robiginitomaculum sp.]